jgi:hypothetical protein
MHASELISKLQALVDEFGDLEVRAGNGHPIQWAPWYGTNDVFKCMDEPGRTKLLLRDGHGFFLD